MCVMPEVCPSRGSTILFVAFLHQAAVLKAAASHGLHPAACAGSATVGVGISGWLLTSLRIHSLRCGTIGRPKAT